MESFAIVVNDFKTLTIVTKLPILDACSGPCHVSKMLLNIKCRELYFVLLQSGVQSTENFISQSRTTCLKLKIKALEQVVKYVQS